MREEAIDLRRWSEDPDAGMDAKRMRLKRQLNLSLDLPADPPGDTQQSGQCESISRPLNQGLHVAAHSGL